MTQTQRYNLQDRSNFYRTQFPNTGFSSRISSFATRVASTESRDGQDTSAAIRAMKKKSLQATCKDLKNEVNKAASMVDYNIKAKHMDNLSSFFASKNFDLVTRIGTPEKPSGSKGAQQVNKKASGQNQNAGDNEEGDLDNTFVCKENIEKDKDEQLLQVESSWAQRQGIPTKSG